MSSAKIRSPLCWQMILGLEKPLCQGYIFVNYRLGFAAPRLIVAPGSLVANWQEELFDKFGLESEIISRAHVESAPNGDRLLDMTFALHVLTCSKWMKNSLGSLQSHLGLIIVDEAHKMSVSIFGNGA